MSKILPQSFYLRDTKIVARELLGKKLTHIVDGHSVSGIIVETEAYLGVVDKAAHTFNGRRTKRNEVMYQKGGVAYVYQIYGLHFCLNAVTREKNTAQAVLIRALQPWEGLELMFERRVSKRRASVRRHIHLASGPGKLCQALHITRLQNGATLYDKKSSLIIEELTGGEGGRLKAMGFDLKRFKIGVSPRIGVDYAGEAALWPLRFFVSGNEHVSRFSG